MGANKSDRNVSVMPGRAAADIVGSDQSDDATRDRNLRAALAKASNLAHFDSLWFV